MTVSHSILKNANNVQYGFALNVLINGSKNQARVQNVGVKKDLLRLKSQGKLNLIYSSSNAIIVNR